MDYSAPYLAGKGISNSRYEALGLGESRLGCGGVGGIKPINL